MICPWIARPFAVAAFLAVLAPCAVRAATPLSVTLGAQFPPQNDARNAGGDTQTDLMVDYDFIHAPVVPIQASFTFDAAEGTHDGGMLNDFGFGASGRLTTPLYIGAGLSVVDINARRSFAGAQNAAAIGLGTDIFVGDRFLSLPGGVNFSLQATYKALPSVAGISPSNYGVGLRVHL